MKVLMRMILVLFLGLASCASMMSSEEEREVLPYQQNFATHSNGKYTLQQVQMVPIFINSYRTFDVKKKRWVDDDDTVGVCYPIGIITINKKWWYSHHDPRAREQLIFHELGHCFLKRNHTAKIDTPDLIHRYENAMFSLGLWTQIPALSDGCPGSYMEPRLFETVYQIPTYQRINCLDKHYEYYMDELFERITREEYENGYKLSD